MGIINKTNRKCDRRRAQILCMYIGGGSGGNTKRTPPPRDRAHHGGDRLPVRPKWSAHGPGHSGYHGNRGSAAMSVVGYVCAERVVWLARESSSSSRLVGRKAYTLYTRTADRAIVGRKNIQ